jgi:hypothetical protein
MLTISAPTKELEESVSPDRLEDVLASLKFRRTIEQFIVGETLTKLTFRSSRMLLLMQALGAETLETD